MPGEVSVVPLLIFNSCRHILRLGNQVGLGNTPFPPLSSLTHDIDSAEETTEKVYETNDARSNRIMTEKLTLARFCTLLVRWLWLSQREAGISQNGG
jgi:hypothetical protein